MAIPCHKFRIGQGLNSYATKFVSRKVSQATLEQEHREVKSPTARLAFSCVPRRDGIVNSDSFACRSPSDVATVTARRRDSLLRLTSLLEDNSTARVYFRASGGLARLAGATVTAATAAAAAHCPSDSGADHPNKNEASTPAVLSPNSAAAAAVNNGGGRAGDDGCCGDERNENTATNVITEEGCSWFSLMLCAVSAALRGGERLAQQEVFNSGLLDGPCAWAMRTVAEKVEDSAATTAMATAAGAAALLLSRVIDDVSVRVHVAR